MTEKPNRKYETRLAQLKLNREPAVQRWTMLRDNFAPMEGKFDGEADRDIVAAMSKIWNTEAVMAPRALKSGMMAGVSSPSRPWFKLRTEDPGLADFGRVKDYLNECERRMYAVYQKSNVYASLPKVYDSMGIFGPAFMTIEEDFDTVIRTRAHPIGTYYLAEGPDGRVNTVYREFDYTVEQLVDRFGVDRVSDHVRSSWERGTNLDDKIKVVHAVQKNVDRDPRRLDARNKPFTSVYYEAAGDGELLSESGFDEFPAIAPRWDGTHIDAYGYGPGLIALGDSKGLQVAEKKSLQAIEKQINPPLQAPASLERKGIKGVPGGVTYHNDMQGPNSGIRSLYEVRLNIEALEFKERQIENRIKQAFHVDLFLMLANSDRRQITAREIEERHEEKLLMLGPVLESIHDEALDPLHERTFAVMNRKGLLPEPPKELQGEDLKVEYVSMLAQAQKAVETGGIERFAGFVGQLASVKPDVLDKFNEDEAIDSYGTALGVDPKIIRSSEEVQERRSQRDQQAQAAQMMSMMQSGAQTAKTLADTETEEGDALSSILKAAQ